MNQKDGPGCIPGQGLVSHTVCGLRRLIFIGDVRISPNTAEAFVLSFNVTEKKPDRMKLLTQI